MTRFGSWLWRVAVMTVVYLLCVVVLSDVISTYQGRVRVFDALAFPLPALYTHGWRDLAIGFGILAAASCAALAANAALTRSLAWEAIRRTWHERQLWRWSWLTKGIVTLLIVAVCGPITFRLCGKQVASAATAFADWLSTLTERPQANTGATLSPAATTPPSASVQSVVQLLSGTTTGVPYWVPAPSIAKVYGPPPIAPPPLASTFAVHLVTRHTLLMLFGAAIAVVTLRLLHLRAPPQDGHIRCLNCDHILKGLTEPRCPECGQKI